MEHRHKTSSILLFYNQEAPVKLMALSSCVWFRLPLPLCKNVWRTQSRGSSHGMRNEFYLISELA